MQNLSGNVLPSFAFARTFPNTRYDLGHSRGYINNISSGKTLPSMTEFFAICDYFDITPEEFFHAANVNPKLSREITELISQLNEDDLALTLANIKRLLK